MATGFTASIKSIWSKELLRIINNNAVTLPLVNTNYEEDFANGGSTVHARLPGQVPIKNYTREQVLAYDSLAWSDNTFTLNQQKYFAFLIDDLDKAQMDVSIIEPQLTQAAINIRNVIDTSLLGNYVNVNPVNIIGSTANPIQLTKDTVYQYISLMVTYMQRGNVGIDADKISIIVPPDIRQLIVNSPQMAQRSTNIVDETIQNGLVTPNFAGARVYITTNMPQVNGVYPLLAFHPLFISYACQVKEMEMIDRLQANFGSGARGLFLYDSVVFPNYNRFGATLYAQPVT